MKSQMIKLVFILFSTMVIFAACSADDADDSSSSAKGEEHTVMIVAKNWEFDQDVYTVPAGTVTIQLENEEGYHGIEIQGTNVTIAGDGSETVELEPGEYTIVCSIQCGTGHEDMMSTLVVE